MAPSLLPLLVQVVGRSYYVCSGAAVDEIDVMMLARLQMG
jgi:hypothetical protein